MNYKIKFDGLLQEMLAASEDYSKQFFRQKIIRVYMKCLKTNKILLSTKIAEKYQKELTEPLRSDLTIAFNYSIFAATVLNHKK